MSAMQAEEIAGEVFISGEKGELIQAHDWSQTSLGAIETWSESLKSALNILFNACCPMLLVWGYDRILFYNDAYSAVLSESNVHIAFGEPINGSKSAVASSIYLEVEQVFSTGRSLQREHQPFLTNQDDNAEVPIYGWCYNPLWDETGQIGGVLATGYRVTDRETTTATDVTECQGIEKTLCDRKKTEEYLWKIEERFRFVTQAVNGLIFDWDLQTNEVYRSSKLYELLGVESEEAPQSASWWHDRIHPDDLARLQPELEQLYANSDGLYDTEYRVRHEDGRWINVWEQASLLRDRQGKITRIVGCTVDITDLRQAESALREKEQQLQQLCDSMPQFVWICSATGELEYVNQQWSEFSGLMLEQTQDRALLETLYHPDDRQLAFDQWAIALETKQTFDLEARLKRSSDGAYRWFLIRAVPSLNEQGQVRRWYGTSTDIHERKLRELHEHFLNQLDNRLRQFTDVKALMWETVSSLGEYLELSRCTFVEIDWQRGQAIVERDWCRDVPSIAGTYAISDFITPEFQATIASGQAALVHDVTTDPRTAAFASNYEVFQTKAFANAPCIYQGRWIADLTVSSKTPRVWRDDEVSLLQETIARIWPLVEQTKAMQALRESEERFRISQELSLDAFTILDSVRDKTGAIVDFIWRYVNPKAAEIIQHSADELLGQSLLKTLPSNQLNSELFKRYVRVVETGDSHDIELSSEADGLIGWFRNMAVKLEDGVAIFFSDITDRKQAEADLQKSEHRFRRLVESNMFGVAFGDFSGKIQYVNDYFLNMVGYTREEIESGQVGWIDITPTEFLPLEEKALAELRVREVAKPFEKEYLSKDGSRVPVFIGLALLQEPYEEQEGIVAFHLNLTEQKQAQAERERLLKEAQMAREEAETANRIKDEFLAVLSHELRSPLNPILGWSKLLQTRKFDEQGRQRALQTIERNAKLQTQLIEDLLDVSRILRGKMSLNICPVNLKTVLESALETVRLAAEAKRIQIQTVIFSDRAQTLGDSARLQQIVWNLLSNAVKFTPDGGQVEVSLNHIGSYAQIQVKDTGKGIKPDFLPYVFDYFRQEDGKITRKFGGLGLGLAIVRHLTELHGGTVQAESPGEGQGATFIVRLPLTIDSVESGKELTATTEFTDLNKLQVLLVDDEPDMRDLAQIVLEQQAMQVRVATSAAEALKLLDEQLPDIFISDIGMPEVDGYMLMQQIRSRAPEQGGLIPAIALTAYAGEYDQQQALKVGFQRHLAKPVEPEDLLKAIADLLRKH